MFAFICKIFGHKWNVGGRDNNFRVCNRCGREQTVWLNKYPKIGEPQTMWADSPSQIHKDLDDSEQGWWPGL